MKYPITAVALAAGLAAGSPAQAQTFLDNLKALKASVKALSGKPAATPPAAGAPQQAPPSADETEGAEMLSAADLVDDPSDSALERVAVVPRRVATFDVLGFRLGMTPREFSRVSRRQKVYRAADPSFAGSFEVEAARLTNEKLNRPVMKRSKSNLVRAVGNARGKGQLSFDFTLEPTGPKLSKLYYALKTNGQTKAQIESALAAKYGPFDRAQDGALYWCASMKGCQFVEKEDRLRVWIGDNSMSMQLYRSFDYLDRAKATLVARANQIAAQAGKPVAF